MRIIAAKRTLQQFWHHYPAAEQPLKAWFDEAHWAMWESPSDLKRQFGSASIISRKRVIFNIHGNAFRLAVDIEYHLKIIFIVWIGTHGKYNNVDVTKLKYVKTHSKRSRI